MTLEVSATPNQAQTIAAYETHLAGLTQTAGVTPLPSPTETPTATSIPPTKIPTPTITPTMQNCNWAEFVRDVTIPDGTEIDGGASFVKTWRLQNLGNCQWTTNYNLIFVRGESFRAPTRVGLPKTVEPGEQVEISLLMEAPTYPGNYVGYYLLSDGRGRTFGTGPDADSPLWVDIIVRSPENVVFDFAEDYCQAEWRSSVEASLPCPGDPTDNENGFVLYSDNPIREDGSVENEAGLITNPDNTDFGFIYGLYPNFTIRKGDLFKSVIGCSFDSQGCNLTFELRYQITGDAMRTIKTWREIYDGTYHSVVADLSDLNGLTVKLILFVENNGTAVNNRGLWIAPRIMR
jgi:hypothetical protein